MKSITIIATSLSCFFLVQTCAVHNANTDPLPAANKTASKEKRIDFEKEVLPVLVKNCSPCHFTGGKMYERLPFDKDSTLINNSEMILKRIGNDEKKAIVKEFILQNKNGVSNSKATNKPGDDQKTY